MFFDFFSEKELPEGRVLVATLLCSTSRFRQLSPVDVLFYFFDFFSEKELPEGRVLVATLLCSTPGLWQLSPDDVFFFFWYVYLLPLTQETRIVRKQGFRSLAWLFADGLPRPDVFDSWMWVRISFLLIALSTVNSGRGSDLALRRCFLLNRLYLEGLITRYFALSQNRYSQAGLMNKGRNQKKCIYIYVYNCSSLLYTCMCEYFS